jgi:anti-anti-sigma factor
MEITVEKIGSVQVMCPHGRLDLVAVAEFERALINRIEAGETRLLIDGSDLRYVSSSGLGSFVNAAKTLGDRGTVTFANLSQHVNRVFEMVGFHNIFQIYASREEALEALAATGG